MRVVEKLKRYLLHRSGSVMMRKFSRLGVIMANHKGSTNRNSNVDNRRITRHLSSNQNCTVQEEGKLWSSHMALCAWLKTKKKQPATFSTVLECLLLSSSSSCGQHMQNLAHVEAHLTMLNWYNRENDDDFVRGIVASASAHAMYSYSILLRVSFCKHHGKM